MTLAMAYARWTPADRKVVAVIADSRLTLKSGPVDAFVKTFELGPNLMMVMAGDGFAPPIAAEMTRPLVVANTGKGLFVDLWAATRLFLSFMQWAFGRLQHATRHPGRANDVLLSGFYADGAPGFALIKVTATATVVDFFRCRRGEVAYWSVGDSVYAKRLDAAVFLALTMQHQNLLGPLVDGVWHAIELNEAEGGSIGGGISLGMAESDSTACGWPVLSVHGRLFHRGFEIEPSLVEGAVVIPCHEQLFDMAGGLGQLSEMGGFGFPGQQPAYRCSGDALLDVPALQRKPLPPELQG